MVNACGARRELPALTTSANHDIEIIGLKRCEVAFALGEEVGKQFEPSDGFFDLLDGGELAAQQNLLLANFELDPFDITPRIDD